MLDQNSPWSVALHLGTALVLFSVLWLIFVRSGAASQGVPAARPLAVLTWLLALATMASAAMMTKSGASLACVDWPLCDGARLPDLTDPLLRLNLAHRLLAAATAVGSLVLFLRLRAQPALARLGHALLALMALEIMLGGLAVILAVPIWAGLVHQALGVLTFGVLSLLMWRVLAPVPRALGDPVHVGLSRA